jgi:hypothetical protein
MMKVVGPSVELAVVKQTINLLCLRLNYIHLFRLTLSVYLYENIKNIFTFLCLTNVCFTKDKIIKKVFPVFYHK